MTVYVVDASVVIQAFIAQTYTVQAIALLNRLTEGDQLHIPEFCLLECANVLWKQIRFQGLPQTEAEQFIGDLLTLPFEVVSVSSLLRRALQVGLVHQLSIYDSLYIALALELNCSLITVDNRQSNAAAASGVILKAITDFS